MCYSLYPGSHVSAFFLLVSSFPFFQNLHAQHHFFFNIVLDHPHAQMASSSSLFYWTTHHIVTYCTVMQLFVMLALGCQVWYKSRGERKVYYSVPYPKTLSDCAWHRVSKMLIKWPNGVALLHSQVGRLFLFKYTIKNSHSELNLDSIPISVSSKFLLQ